MRKRYFIPINFIPEGYAFANIRWVNLFQAIIAVIAILIPVITLLPFGFKGKLYTSIILVIPVGFITLIGVNGLSITAYLADVIDSRKHGKVYKKPTPSDQIYRQKSLERKRHAQMRAKDKEMKKQSREERKSARINRRARKDADDE